MMRLYRFLSLAALALLTLPAQAQDCTCAASFELVVQNYESNYSLFNIKVTDENRELYKAYTDVFRSRASEVKEIENCLPVLTQWLQFFRDGHTGIKFTGTGSQAAKRERIETDRKKFEATYKKKGYRKNDLPGIWQYGAYEVAIMPDPTASTQSKDYVGVILSSANKLWKPGDIKFKLSHVYGNDYKAVVFMDDDSGKKLEGELRNPNELEFKNFNRWAKSWPNSAPATAAKEQADLYSDFHIRMLDGKVPYVRFLNFYEKEPAFVDSLFKAHHDQLVQADFIVVDVRDNDGGNDNVYFPALPYILSGPIQIPQAGMWMSEGNLETALEGVDPETLNEADRAEYDFLMAQKNSIFWYGNDDYARTYTPKTVFAPHQKVAVLMNGKTASSGETFVYRAMQSDKVVLYGQNTAGVVDGFTVFTKRIGCFELRYPSSLRAKDIADNPVDPYGFAPDVYISPDADALEFSIRQIGRAHV